MAIDLRKEREVISQDDSLVIEAFNSLMGINGDEFAQEIMNTGVLSQVSYDIINNNVIYNGKSSIIKYYGLVQWYYLAGLKIDKM